VVNKFSGPSGAKSAPKGRGKEQFTTFFSSFSHLRSRGAVSMVTTKPKINVRICLNIVHFESKAKFSFFVLAGELNGREISNSGKLGDFKVCVRMHSKLTNLTAVTSKKQSKVTV
jgi:hypothetical protein